MEDLIKIEGYSILEDNVSPKAGDIGIYVDEEQHIGHYELFLDNDGRVDSKGGFEKYVERDQGGTDSNWKDMKYIRLRLNTQIQENDKK